MHEILKKSELLEGRRSQGNKGTPCLTNRLRSQLSEPENETKLSNSPWNDETLQLGLFNDDSLKHGLLRLYCNSGVETALQQAVRRRTFCFIVNFLHPSILFSHFTRLRCCL